MECVNFLRFLLVRIKPFCMSKTGRTTIKHWNAYCISVSSFHETHKELLFSFFRKHTGTFTAVRFRKHEELETLSPGVLAGEGNSCRYSVSHFTFLSCFNLRSAPVSAPSPGGKRATQTSLSGAWQGGFVAGQALGERSPLTFCWIFFPSILKYIFSSPERMDI